jgi:hypothetical protein
MKKTSSGSKKGAKAAVLPPILAGVPMRATHETNLQFVAFHLETLPEDIAKNTARILGGTLDGNLPVLFDGAAGDFFKLATLRYYFLNASAAEVTPLLRRAADALANLFRLVAPVGSPVTFSWENVERTVVGAGHMDLQNGLQLDRGLLLAVISGNRQARNYLGGLPRDSYEHPQIRLPATDFAKLATLQSLARGDNTAASAHLQDLQQLETPTALGKSADSYRKSSEPDITAAIGAILNGDGPKCEQAIAAVLEKHQKTFDSDVENNRNRPNGFMSVNALMLAQFARERGVRITLENRYLPLALLDAAYQPSG